MRERFDPTTGNPTLGPEMIDHFEVRAIEKLNEMLRIELAPFYKHQTGTVQSSQNPADDGRLVNLGTVDIYGVDVLGRVTPVKRVEIGGAWDYVRDSSILDGVTTQDPINRLPHTKLEGWVQLTPDPHFSLISRVMYFGQSIDSGTVLPGYTTVELTATAPISRKYLAVAKCEDLFNVAPEIRAGYRTPGRITSLMLQGTWE